MTPTAIEERVRAAVHKVAPHVASGFRGSADLYREVGVKSLTALELLLCLEDDLGVQIDDEAFGDARSVDRLVSYLGSVLEQRESA
jgi:acyl carrier protein